MLTRCCWWWSWWWCYLDFQVRWWTSHVLMCLRVTCIRQPRGPGGGDRRPAVTLWRTGTARDRPSETPSAVPLHPPGVLGGVLPAILGDTNQEGFFSQSASTFFPATRSGAADRLFRSAKMKLDDFQVQSTELFKGGKVVAGFFLKAITFPPLDWGCFACTVSLPV